MKKVIFSSIVAMSLLSSLHAYELNGNLDVKWTGFKTERKVGVSGTFQDIKLMIQKSEDFKLFLKSAYVKIDTLKIDSKMPFRDKNITSTLFSLDSAKNIDAKIIDVKGDDKKGTLVLSLTMNQVTKNVEMNYTVEDSKVKAEGRIEILDYALSNSFNEFAQKCKVFHQSKTFSNVDISFTLPFK